MSKKIKLIVLDIDNVLNDANSPPLYSKGWPANHLKENLIARVNKIAREASSEDLPTKIVISSSWRLHFSLEKLTELLVSKGLEPEIIGVTPTLPPRRMSEHIPRGREIQAWLKSTEFDVVSFVILDDIDDMEHLSKYLVQPDADLGIQDADVLRAIEILNGNI